MPVRSVLSFRSCYNDSNAGHLCVGFQFGALQNLHGRFPVVLVFGLVLKFSILCFGSSLINRFSSVVINASGIVFFLFFFSYEFCLIISIVFFISRVFSFISLSRNFLSVIAVMYLDINSSSAEMVPKLHSFSISVVSRTLRVFHSPIVSPKRSLLYCDMCFVLGGSVRYITGLGL